MRFSPMFRCAGALTGLLLACGVSEAQVRGGPTGGIGGSSFGGSSFSGGMGGSSFSGSGGFSGSSTSSGFRPQGLSSPLQRGGTGFVGQQTSSPFGQAYGSFSGGMSGGIYGNTFGMSGGLAGNRGLLGGGQLAGMSGMNNRFGMGGGVKLATATMGAALNPIPPAASDVLPRLDKILADTAPPNSERDLQMEMEGATLVLKAMLRLEPGVYEIRNDLQVRRPPVPAKTPAKPKPKP